MSCFTFQASVSSSVNQGTSSTAPKALKPCLLFLTLLPALPSLSPRRPTYGRQASPSHSFPQAFDSGAQLVFRGACLESWDPEKIRQYLQRKKNLGLLQALTSLFLEYHEIPTSDPRFAQLAIFEESGSERLRLIPSDSLEFVHCLMPLREVSSPWLFVSRDVAQSPP